MRYIVYAMILLLGFARCRIIKPSRPNLPPSRIDTVPLPDSKIDVPIAVNMTGIFQDFNTNIPIDYGGSGNAGPGQYRWSVHRDPFILSLSGARLDVIDAAHCSGGGYLKNPFNGNWNKVCGCDIGVTLGLACEFGLAPDYGMRGNARLTRFDADDCRLTFANFNVTPIMKPIATDAINKGINSLNQKINSYNLRQYIAAGWNALFQPIPVDTFGFIGINPSAVRLDSLGGSGSTLYARVGITAKPVMSTANPGTPPIPSLPDLSAAQGEGFSLVADAHIGYGELNNLLASQLGGRRFPTGKKGSILIKSATVFGEGNNHLLINVAFSGKYGWICYHGNLFLTTLPVYDAAVGILYFNDIDFDAGTKASLAQKSADWILNSAFALFLHDQIKLNISGDIDRLRAALSKAVNRPVGNAITLSGSVDRLALQGLLPLQDYLLLRISAGGSLALSVIPAF